MPDIKLLRPQRLSDNPDGGGLATSIEIVDGEINNLLDDNSRIDRINGDVSLRPFFAIADTEDASTFLGVHFIVKSPPLDESVSALLFRATAWADERADARNAVERYLDPSVVTRMLPYGRQLAGQRTLLVYQRGNLPLPDVGEVYVLANEAGTQLEFVRVQAVSDRVELFTNERDLEYQVRVVTLTLSQPLQAEWPGSEVNPRFTRDPGGSLLRASSVSDAARYYGTVPLGVDADSGDLTIKLGTVYGQLIPAAVAESAVTDAPAGGSTTQLASAAPGVVVASESIPFNLSAVSRVYRTQVDYLWGSLVVTFAALAQVTIFTQQADGSFVGAGPNVSAYAVSADRDSGLVSINITGLFGSGNIVTVTATPAVAINQASLSYNQPITLGTRGTVYVATLEPVPGPGSLSISYRAGGRWYELQDDGAGVLSSSPGLGVGAINYATGTVSVTLGALPDVGSSIIYAWSQQSTYEIRTQAIATQVPEVVLQLSTGCEPGSLSIEWEAGGVTKSATDNGAGALTGDATGEVQYSTGAVALRPTVLPDDSTEFEVEYDAADVETELFTPSKSGSTITITAAGAMRERSVLVTYSQSRQQGPLLVSTTQQLADNGAGQLVDADGNIKAGSVVNYATGEISFNPDFTAVTPTLSYSDFSQGLPARTVDPSTGYFAAQAQFGLWPSACGNEITAVGFLDGSNVTLQYKPDGATDDARTASFPAPPIRVRLNRGTSNTIVPGSLLFELGGARYIDRSGRLVRDPSVTTGAGLDAGTVSYSTGEATITSWAANVAPALNVRALLTQVRPLPLSVATGRTPGSPLRPGSFILQANRYSNGGLMTAVADQNGQISTADMHGYVDSVTGVWSVAFGRWVLDSSLTLDEKSEPWYSVDAINEDGYIWRPIEATPGTVRFSCVVQVALPLDESIIGVNPVRLPQDGRVQIVRAGDTLVIHDTQGETLPNPAVAGAVYDMGRTGLASAVLYDANGLGIPPDRFSVDKAAGEITMADPLVLTGYAQPLTALHTVEDMALCTDAQIDGTVTIAQPLTRGYTAANALVSSALVVGDLAARVASLFAQSTWTGVWSDILIGTAPGSGAAYNDVAYPLVVVNADCITQRWRIQFTSSTAFSVVAEELGVVGTGTTSSNVAPINPATGEPYFTMAAAGFGTGWATGNLIRFNTVAGGAKVWVARAIRPAAAAVLDDRILIQARYDLG